MKQNLYPDEIVFIKKNYNTLNYGEILNHINSNRKSNEQIKYSLLRHRFRDLGLSKFSMKHWSKIQIQILTDNYRTKGNTEIATLCRKHAKGGKTGMTSKQVSKKLKLLDIHRTPKELSAVVQRNIKLGLTYVNKPGIAVVKGKPEGHMTIHKLNGHTSYNFIKVNGYYRMYGKYNYERTVGEVPNGYMLFRIDLDSLNDHISNYKIRKRGPLTPKEISEGLKLLSIRIKILNKELLSIYSQENKAELIVKKSRFNRKKQQERLKKSRLNVKQRRTEKRLEIRRLETIKRKYKQ